MRFIGVISLFLLAWLGADGWLARGQGYSHRLLLFACSSTASQNNHNHAQPSSVHLQLQNIQSTFTDTNIHNKEKKLTSFAYLHAFVNIANHSDILTACTSATASNISIDSLDNFSQFPTNEEDTKAFARLVYFSRHILMQQWPYVEQERDKQELPSFTRLTHNDTQISYGGIVYRYQTLNIPLDDEDQFRLYEQLWRSGRLLLRYRSLEDEWDSFRQDEDGLKQKANLNKLTFEQLLVSNVFKRIQLTADLTTVLTLRKYLQNTELTIQERNTNLYDLYKYESYRSREEHVDTVKQFSMWFKQQFPYYHDKCLTCDNRQENRFLGMIHPSNVEIIDSASRTESYLCAVCQSVSRFPRFQDMTKVLKSKRGRCGEYSVMMYFMLSALGYQSRWVVDRDDHVWAEFYLSSSKEWIHIDPCEAAVNEPYIYSHWGKTPTFILAFEASKITDVTQYYIDPASLPANVTVMEAIEERRAAENVNTTYFNTMLGRGEMYLRGLRVLSRNLQ